MESAANYRRAIAAVLTVASASALIWFGNGLEPSWPLLWLAPLPVLLFTLGESWWRTGLVAASAWLIGSLNLWHYFRVLGVPASAWAGLSSGAAVAFAAAVLLFRALVRRGALWTALFAFPAAWTSCEYLNSIMSPHGTAGSLAYSQLNFLPLLQLASVAGPWAMSFVLLLFPAAIVIGVHRRHSQPRHAVRMVGTAFGLIALALLFGAMRLTLSGPHQEVRVGLVASDAQANAVAAEGEETDRVLRDYAAAAESLASRGAELIVLPEKLGVISDPHTAQADHLFQSLANRTKATIVVGLIHASAAAKSNEVRVYAPDTPVLSYSKHHLLPPFESEFKPGTELTVIRRSSVLAGVEICKDMVFTGLSRQYGRTGAGIMLVPAWDFNLDRSWHGHIAIMRGVENGFSIARAARNGYLTMSDDRGRITAEARSDGAPFATLIGNVPATHRVTIYSLLGDWFAWLSLALLAFALVQLCRLHASGKNRGRRKSVVSVASGTGNRSGSWKKRAYN